MLHLVKAYWIQEKRDLEKDQLELASGWPF
jgi:hypothetical protein